MPLPILTLPLDRDDSDALAQRYPPFQSKPADPQHHHHFHQQHVDPHGHGGAFDAHQANDFTDDGVAFMDFMSFQNAGFGMNQGLGFGFPMDMYGGGQAFGAPNAFDAPPPHAFDPAPTMDFDLAAPTPRAFAFGQGPGMFDGATPRVSAFPPAVHAAMRPPLPPSSQTPISASTSTSASVSASASPSPAPSQSQSQTESQSPLSRIRIPPLPLRSASPAAQIASFNAPAPSSPLSPLGGAPITLAHRRRGSSISSLSLQPSSSSSAHLSSVTVAAGGGGLGGPGGTAITLNGTGVGAERRPKRGDEDYIKRPENAFILFRRDCCLRKNQAEAASAADPSDSTSVGPERRQRQADLSKTISQQWRALSSAERKYWDDLAKQKKREHEEMYPWYVYQPSRSKKERKGGKASGVGKEGGVGEEGEEEVEGKKERSPSVARSTTSAAESASNGGGKDKKRRRDRERERERRSSRAHRSTRERPESRVRASRGLSTCSSTASNDTAASLMSASSLRTHSATTTSSATESSSLDSDEFDAFGPGSGVGGGGDLYDSSGSISATSSTNESGFSFTHFSGFPAQATTQGMDFDMGDASSSSNVAIDTRNPLASFALESDSDPLTFSSSSSSFHHHPSSQHAPPHAHFNHTGHAHSLSTGGAPPAPFPGMGGPLSYVVAPPPGFYSGLGASQGSSQGVGQGSGASGRARRSTSAPGAPATPPPPMMPIRLPTLFGVEGERREGEREREERREDVDAMDVEEREEEREVEQQASFYSHQPQQQHQHQPQPRSPPQTARQATHARPRALSEIVIPPAPATGAPLSAPAPPNAHPSSSSSSGQGQQQHRLYFPSQPHFSPTATVAPPPLARAYSMSGFGPSFGLGAHLQPPRAIPLGLPESPRASVGGAGEGGVGAGAVAGTGWDDTLGLPAWAMPTVFASSPASASSGTASDTPSHAETQSVPSSAVASPAVASAQPQSQSHQGRGDDHDHDHDHDHAQAQEFDMAHMIDFSALPPFAFSPPGSAVGFPPPPSSSSSASEGFGPRGSDSGAGIGVGGEGNNGNGVHHAEHNGQNGQSDGATDPFALHFNFDDLLDPSSHL